jgi:hypothetical protein|tara:strand:+ start:818 stop:979 length:162 start_codon:yes stop_codon:yes gene_type:complete
MESLNETIACYIEELVDIKRDKELSIEEKTAKLNEIGSQLIKEEDYIYNENKK